MLNLDLLEKRKADIMQAMHDAMKSGDENAFKEAFTKFTDFLQEAVMNEAKGLIQAADNHVLAGRGTRALTSEENEYYQKLIEAMKSRDPKQAITSMDVVLPKTVIDSVFDDIVESHPLLDAINFVPTDALTEILVSTLNGRQLGVWGKLTAEIVKELSAGFTNIKLDQKKESAFLPISKPMLDLGPVWIDRYVRAHLSEAIYNGLEAVIIDGSGVDSPVGMRRNPASALDPTNGYALLVARSINEINPQTYGELIADLSVAPTGLQRVISEVLFIVSPKDYFTRIFSATTYRQQDGSYVNNIFPFPTRLIQSVYVPAGEAVIGIGQRYFMGLGTGKGGKIEYSDEYHFLEDERIYLIKLYGDGRPLDNKSFIRLDISKLKPSYPVVRNIPYADAALKSLTVAAGAVAITPAFDSAKHYYTADTANASDAVAAVAVDANAVITGTLNGAAADLTKALAWVEGQNVVVLTVTNGDRVETYVLVVTYTPEA